MIDFSIYETVLRSMESVPGTATVSLAKNSTATYLHKSVGETLETSFQIAYTHTMLFMTSIITSDPSHISFEDHQLYKPDNLTNNSKNSCFPQF